MTMATTSPWLAVAAGMLTVGAPCVLPMLPVVLGASVSSARTPIAAVATRAEGNPADPAGSQF